MLKLNLIFSPSYLSMIVCSRGIVGLASIVLAGVNHSISVHPPLFIYSHQHTIMIGVLHKVPPSFPKRVNTIVSTIQLEECFFNIIKTPWANGISSEVLFLIYFSTKQHFIFFSKFTSINSIRSPLSLF